MLFYYYHGASAQIPCMSVGVMNLINNFRCVMASYSMDVMTHYTVLVAYKGGDEDCRSVRLVVANVNYLLHFVNNFQQLFPGWNYPVFCGHVESCKVSSCSSFPRFWRHKITV